MTIDDLNEGYGSSRLESKRRILKLLNFFEGIMDFNDPDIEKEIQWLRSYVENRP